MLIHQLAAAGQSDRVLELVAAGADPEATDTLGATVLVAAARSAQALHRASEPVDSQLAVVTRLLANGVNADARDRFGRTAGEWLTGVPGGQEVPGWRPEPAYPPYTSALLSLLRRDLGPREPAPVDPAPADGQPPVVSEFVALLGDPPRTWVRLGYWSIEVRGVLLPGAIELDGIPGPALPYDWRYSYQVGTGYYNEVLILSWTPGSDEVRMWGYDVKEAYAYPDAEVRALGTLEEFLANLTNETVLRDRYVVPDADVPGGLPDLLICADPPRFAPVPVPPAAQGAGDASEPTGIGTTMVELLGCFVLDFGALTRALPTDHPTYAVTCREIRETLLGLVAGGAVVVKGRGPDGDEVALTLDELIVDPELAVPGSRVWRPNATNRLRLYEASDYYRHLPDTDGRTEVPPPDEVDPDDVDAERFAQPVRDLLSFIDINDECPLGWLRPPLGTDSAVLAPTLDHARETVLDLYRAGLIEFLLADGVAGDDVPALVAEDRYWATWCNDVLVRTTPAGTEVADYYPDEDDDFEEDFEDDDEDQVEDD
jgi:hypothetical protein